MNLRNKLPFFLAHVKKARKPVFLEYVESNGRCYIDTGFKPNQDTTVNITWSERDEIHQGATFFGARDDSSPTNAFLFWAAGAGYWRDQYGNQNFTSTVLSDTEKHTLIKYKNKTYLDGELFKEHAYTEFNCSHNIYLFCVNEGGVASYPGKVRIYSCLIYDNGELVLDLHPALDPNGKVCMYDTVTKKYFYNAGTEELKAGGRFVESIVFDGASYIDTGVIPSNNMEFEAGVMFSTVQSTNLAIIASRDGEKRYQPIGAIQNKWSASIGGMYDKNGSPVAANIKYDLRSVVSNGDSVSLYSGNTLVSSATSSEGVPTRSLYLFARNSSSVDSYVTGRLYYCKIWDNGTLVQDLRPYVDSNGVACFKDVITDTLFYGKGTGTLTHTEFEELEYLEFDGTKYIDTGYKPNSNSSVSCTYYPYYNAVFYCVFGTQNDATTGRFYAVVSSTLYRLQLNSGDISVFYGVDPTGLRLASNGSFTSIQQKVSLTIDNYNKQIKVVSDELTNTYDMTQYAYEGNNLGEVECHYNLLIGNRNNSGVISNSNMFKGQISSFEIKENGKLVRDFVPVKRSDGVSCMYDRVGNKYYELISA